MIAVSMPWYRTPPDLFEAAVRSALAQDVPVRLVIIGDGEEPPLPVSDQRIVTYTLPENRGPYFCHQLLLLASPYEWFAVHDSDDWAEPVHLSALRSLGKDIAVPGCIWWHDIRRGVRKPYKREGRWHYGLFRRSTFLSVGGYDPSRRIANDNHTLRTLALVTGVHKSMRPTYHRQKRLGSLTSTPETSMLSERRRAERSYNGRILDRCRAIVDEGGTAADIRDYREAMVPAAVHEELAVHAGKLRGLL